MTPPMSNTPARKAQEERDAITDKLDSRNGHPATIHTPVECLVPRGDRCGSCVRCNPGWFGMYLCATCGNKRCPASVNCDYECNHSNDTGQTAVLRVPTPAPLPVAENTDAGEQSIAGFQATCPHWMLKRGRCTNCGTMPTPVPAPSDTGPSDEAAVESDVYCGKCCTTRRHEALAPNSWLCTFCMSIRPRSGSEVTPTSRPSTDGDAEELADWRKAVESLVAVMSPAAEDHHTRDDLRAFAARILKSDWLAQRDAALVAAAEARVGERIALAIEAMPAIDPSEGPWSGAAVGGAYRLLLKDAAAIARATGSES